MAEHSLPHGCELIDIPSVTDERGTLAFATGRKEIPFDISRVFWIYDVPPGQRRGGHAHRTCAEAIFVVKGEVAIAVDDGAMRTQVLLSTPTRGLLVPAGLWCELSRFGEGTVLAVAASHPYDAEGYIHSYERYLQERGAKR